MLWAATPGCTTMGGMNVAPTANFAAGNSGSWQTAERPDTGYRVLFSFGSNASGLDGWVPEANLTAADGALYGTTAFGGTLGCGTVFRMTTAGNETVLHAFNCTTDGGYPAAGLSLVKGVLYGVTGGAAVYGQTGFGTVFRVSPQGQHFRVVHAFRGPDGAYPLAAMLEVNGMLYGTTYGGGTYGNGTVFRLNPATGAEHVMHSFSGNTDGGNPMGGLLFLGGRLYGTTQLGGSQRGGGGTVFRMALTGAEKVLHSFGSSPDGINPRAGLVAINQRLYGTTEAGGAYDDGTVFRISTSGTEHVLHSFGGGSDGSDPRASLVIVNGTLYGTTSAGGKVTYGTIFQISPRGHERILHILGTVPNDGASPGASLLDFNGKLYGTTEYGGASSPSCPKSGGCAFGTVFALRP